MNTQDKARQVNFSIDMKPWLRSGAGKYELISYDQFGKKINTHSIAGFKWTGKTSLMKKYDLEIYELTAR
jgi:hypothetical protein